MSTHHYSKDLEIHLPATVEYNVTPGYKGDHWQPPEPPEITDIRVLSCGQDITSSVPQSQLDAIEADLLRNFEPDDKEECP